MARASVSGANFIIKCVDVIFTNPAYAPTHGDIMKINKKDHNWYGFDTGKVCETFEGDLTYLNTFCILGRYNPVAVFRNANPNRSKDHKDFLLLYSFTDLVTRKEVTMISGIDADKMEEHRYQTGMYCPNCKEVIYSVNRHDYRKCKCGRCMVDGGKDYFKTNMAGTMVKIDLLTDDIETT
jgi:hypothetical protein